MSDLALAVKVAWRLAAALGCVDAYRRLMCGVANLFDLTKENHQ